MLILLKFNKLILSLKKNINKILQKNNYNKKTKQKPTKNPSGRHKKHVLGKIKKAF